MDKFTGGSAVAPHITTDYTTEYTTGFDTQEPPPSSIVNPALAWKRLVTYTVYKILLVTAPIFCFVYSILWSQIQPPLDLFETGNGWTFILLLTTSIVVTLLAIRPIWLHRNGFKMRWKHVVLCDLLLMACCTAMMVVCIGAMEEVADRSQCKNPGVKCTKYYAPKVPTTFGMYVAYVCGKNGNYSGITTNGLYNKTISDFNAAKCEATKVLKTEIYCMYIWGIELFVLQLIETTFGLGNWRKRHEPEFVLTG